MSLDRIPATLKSGKEPLLFNGKPLDVTLLDFWRWSVSDLLSNATRGRLAEFIVARAAHVDVTACRDEWSAFNLETPEGIKLEVKSAAYVQSWFQRALSRISFSTRAALYWDSATNLQSKVAGRSADVYVFCLLHHQDKATANPLDLNQWTFYVLATWELDAYRRSQHSITLKSLNSLAPPLAFDQLGAAILEKARPRT
ncbi:hypothetical protein [Flaviaesturariibacter amylovorans]|uniref:Restriction endonuclease n=1 Tax=Flaviaesturariibacter amylovorans TaxID=1084520 RepID=A0ABP8HK73_9BACT